MRLILSLVFLYTFLHAITAAAVIRVEVTQWLETAHPIAIVPFVWDGTHAPPQDIAQIVSADLTRSGKFAPVALAELVARPKSSADIAFSNWKTGGIEHLVIGKLKIASEGAYIAQFQLFDIYKEKQIVGYSFPVQAKQLRQAAHEISDIIFEKITGLRGAFGTRLAYVKVVEQSSDESDYILQIADSDGFDPQVILSSKQPLMSPSWSPDGQQIAYVSFEDRQTSAIYVQVVATGSRRMVSSVPGINGAPVWSPDGKKLALTLSHQGNPDIYILDLASGQLRQLTFNRAIDTEATWDPSGDKIIWTSNRSGGAQLYEISTGGKQAHRLTFEGRYNASPAVSPDGKLVAMVHSDRGQFRIAVLDRESSQLRVLTNGYLDESPSFSPNGSMIIYAAAGSAQGVLESVSTDGRIKQRFTVSDVDVREPAWSPFLK